MPRRSAPSTTLIARVRAYFGITCAELALFLGVAEATVRHAENGRRPLTAASLEGLKPLASQLPPPGTPPPAPARTVPDAVELAYQRARCRSQQQRLGRELSQLEQLAEVAARWAAAAPGLLATAEAERPTPTHLAWLRGWLTQRTQPLTPAQAARRRVLQARLAGLAAELAALEAEEG